MAKVKNEKNKTLIERWKDDKNPVGIIKGGKRGKKIPITRVNDAFKGLEKRGK